MLERRHKIAILAVIIIGIVFLGFKYFNNRQEAVEQEEIVFTDDSSDSSGYSQPAENSNSNNKIYVHVVGCVRKPGVYSIPYGARVFQAIKAAGGATKDANLDTLNLASPIQDGAKLDVPAIGEDPETNTLSQSPITYSPSYNGSYNSGYTPSTSSLHSKSSGSSGNKLSSTSQGSVNINTAGPEELTRLPGVGPSTAQKIIEYRQQTGRFSSPQQLTEVKGIGPKKFAKMQPFVVCN